MVLWLDVVVVKDMLCSSCTMGIRLQKSEVTKADH